MAVKKAKTDRTENKAKAASEVATLKADIKAFGAESKSIRRKAQEIMYRCVFVCLEHRNCSPMTLLLKEMGEAWHMKAVIRWLEDFGAVRYQNDEKSFKLSPNHEAIRAEYVADRKTFGSNLKKKPVFWEHTKNPEYKGFDLIAKINAAIKEATNTANDKDKMASGKVKNLAHLDALKAFAATLEPESDDDDGEPETGTPTPTMDPVIEAPALH